MGELDINELEELRQELQSNDPEVRRRAEMKLALIISKADIKTRPYVEPHTSWYWTIFKGFWLWGLWGSIILWSALRLDWSPWIQIPLAVVTFFAFPLLFAVIYGVWKLICAIGRGLRFIARGLLFIVVSLPVAVIAIWRAFRFIWDGLAPRSMDTWKSQGFRSTQVYLLGYSVAAITPLWIYIFYLWNIRQLQIDLWLLPVIAIWAIVSVAGLVLVLKRLTEGVDPNQSYLKATSGLVAAVMVFCLSVIYIFRYHYDVSYLFIPLGVLVPLLVPLITWSIKYSGAFRSRDRCATILSRSHSVDNRRRAAAALPRLLVKNANATVEPLVTALKDASPKVRRQVAVSLGKIGNPKAMNALKAAVKDDAPDVCGAAAEALGKTGNSATSDILIKLSMNKNKRVRTSAQKGLFHLCSRQEFKPITKDKLPSILCPSCLCRFEEHKAKKGLSFCICRKCHSVTSVKNAARVVAVLDHTQKSLYVHDTNALLVNWYQRKEPFDLDEIEIRDARDFDVDELVMKIRNDMDDRRRKRYRSLSVYLSPQLQLSPGKISMLKDTFGRVKTRD
jgi:hypothetical protein